MILKFLGFAALLEVVGFERGVTVDGEERVGSRSEIVVSVGMLQGGWQGPVMVVTRPRHQGLVTKLRVSWQLVSGQGWSHTCLRIMHPHPQVTTILYPLIVTIHIRLSGFVKEGC